MSVKFKDLHKVYQVGVVLSIILAITILTLLLYMVYTIATNTEIPQEELQHVR